MSQIFKDSGGSPAADVETLTGNVGGAVGPDGAFNINILGTGDISVTGNPGTNTLTIADDSETNGTGQTIGAVTDDVITLALGAVAGTFTLEGRVAGFESTNPAAVGYQLFGTVRTTGAAAVLVGTVDQVVNEEAALVGADATIVVSGNNAIVRVTGVAAVTIDWAAHLETTEITP